MKKNYRHNIVLIFISIVMAVVFVACSSVESVTFFSKNSPAMNREHLRVFSELYNESLIGFENGDGTDTLYIFSSPAYVKYNNSYRVIDNTIIYVNDPELKKLYLFSNYINDIRTYLPERVSTQNGIRIETSNVKMDIYPNFDDINESSRVMHRNIYGKDNEHILYESSSNRKKYYVNITDFGINTELLLHNDDSTGLYILCYNYYNENILRGIVYA